MILGNSLWHLVKQTDILSKAIMLVLLGMSVAQWTIFITIVLLCYRKKNDLKQVQNRLSTISHLHQIADIATLYKETLPGFLLLRTVNYIRTGLVHAGPVDHVREVLDQEIDIIIAQEERFTPVLSTSAVISPLLGLLGTVWGLIHAFMNISQTQIADIATVAPGIAEALLTTLAGLMVAIPAVVMVNYNTAQVAYIERQLICIADQVLRIIQHAKHTTGSTSLSSLVKGEGACVDLAADVSKEARQ